jgi:hypothetical protein
MPRSSVALPLDWLALGVGLLAIVAVWLSGFEGFTFGNDPQYALGTGFRVQPGDPFVKRLEEGAIANCPPEDKKWCPPYQQLLHSDLFFNYPLYAGFGRTIALHEGEAFAIAASAAAIGAVATGFGIALGIFLLVSATLPAFLRLALAAVFLASAPAFVWGRAIGFGQLDIGTSMTWRRVAVLAIGIGAAAALAHLPAARRIAESLRGRFAREHPWQLLCGSAVLILAALAGRILLRDPFLVWCFGVAGFGILIAAACIIGRTGHIIGITIGLVLFLLVSPNNFFALVTHTAPRGNIFLIAAPLLAYLAYRPNGRLVFLLPIFALFHISVAGLIAAALLLVELVVWLKRREATWLLGVSALVALASRIYSALVFNAFGAGTDLATTLRAILESDRLLPGALFAGGLFAAGLYLLSRSEPVWRPCARVVLLTAILAAIGQIPPILDLAGHTFFEPGMTVILLAPGYLAPAVAISVTLVLLGSFAGLTCETRCDRVVVQNGAILALVAVALLAVVRVEGRAMPLAAWASGLARGAVQLASLRGDPDPRRDPLFSRLEAADDRYFLRTAVGPRNDPIIYLSLLKYKVRLSAGVFDPNRAVIENIDGSLAENQPQGASP